MSSDPKQAEYSDRMLCDPWRGARTPEFRKFKRDFKASADATLEKTRLPVLSDPRLVCVPADNTPDGF